MLSRLVPLAARLAAVTATTALAVTVAAHGPVPARWAEVADALTPLAGHFLIGGCAAFLACLFPRRALGLMTAGVTIALLGHAELAISSQQSWHPTAMAAHATAAEPQRSLRVYSLNVWDHHPDLDRLEHAVAAVDADIVVLAETDRSKIAMLERLKSQFPYQVSCSNRAECGMAILSRLPILNGDAGRARYDVPPIAWARVDAARYGLGIVTVVGTHVHRPTRSPALHAKQIASLEAMLRQQSGPMIVAGDFNTSPWSASFQDLMRTTGLVPFARLLPTWPAAPLLAPQFAIDHIFVSPDLAFTRTGLGPATGSDHMPVIAEIGARIGRITAKPAVALKGSPAN